MYTAATMQDRYAWQENEPFEYNFAVHKIPPFMDKLLALHDPSSYLSGPATWYKDWRESPGGIMLNRSVTPYEREKALRTDFMPIARYVEHQTTHDLRYTFLRRFVVMNAIEPDRLIWANQQGRPYGFTELVPVDIGEIMFGKWVDHDHSHQSVVAKLEGISLGHLVS